MSNFLKITIVLLALAVVIGCGKPKVKGKVYFSDDKSPVTQGTVLFHRDNEISRGIIQKDGTFVVGTLSARDGLAPGNYRISIKNTQIDISGGSIMPVFQNVIDRKYEDPGTSELTLEVKKSQTFDIPVDRFQDTRH